MSASAPLQASSASRQAAARELIGVLVVLISPSTCQDQQRYDELQKLRQEHDRAFSRWLPHITLIPPFILSSASVKASVEDKDNALQALLELHHDRIAQIVQAASESCRQHPPHMLLLDQVATFRLNKCTNVHIRPHPTNFEHKCTEPTASGRDAQWSSRPIVELQKTLVDALQPLVGGKRRRNEVFKPHVSLGQSTSPKGTWHLCKSAERMLKGNLGGEGMLCVVDKVQLMVKPKADPGPYVVHQEMSLGSSK